ncbi:MAG: NAD(+) diphosphatase [Methanoregula sp.]|nr:NAD(+) diphosphatase [Methanoregula sp.]MDD5023628.1 NAD(+) diphosphatase [Methanoregula sp.]MDD5186677.1 NAD(+) diphosphatase [Methanoregula sp.]
MHETHTLHHTARFSVTGLSQRYPEPGSVPDKNVIWVIISGTDVAITPGDPPWLFSATDPARDGCSVLSVQYLGHRGETLCYAAELNIGSPLPGTMECCGVRALFHRLTDEELAIAAYAVRIIDFTRTTRYCGRCGARTRQIRTERAAFCTDCNLITYPRTSPAIIVLVRDGAKILLARSPHFPPGMHSLVAGFVEPGETLEEAVHREVKEEVGITIKNLRYVASEPWPFPNSLMCGFVADHDSGEITIDNDEITSAGWFDRDHLPVLPSQMSLSRALIDAWTAGEIRSDR